MIMARMAEMMSTNGQINLHTLDQMYDRWGLIDDP